MSAARILSALAGAGARRPLVVIALAVALGAGGAALALRLHPTAAAGTFVGRSSAAYRATQRYYGAFGEEPVDVMVQGDLRRLLLGSDIERLLGLEGCLSGNVPAAALGREGGPNGPCARLGRLGTVKVVIGPATFVNEVAILIDEQLAARSKLAETESVRAERTIRAAALAAGRSASEAHKLGEEAGAATRERYIQQIALLGAEYGLTAAPAINVASFVDKVVFDGAAKLPGTPKQRFAYLFPGREAALVSVRMKAGTDEARRARTIALIRDALRMPQWRLHYGGRYLLTGEPVIVSELTDSITRSIELLLAAVLLVMAVALGLVFRGRPRLLALGIAALATALTFGGLAAFGASLTVAQVAVLPVMIGLAVDYAIQFQARVQEAREEGRGEAREEDREGARGEAREEHGGASVLAVRRAAAVGGPTLLAAAAAGAGALLVVMLSPVPTVRGFALLLIAGIAVALLCAVVVGSAVLALGGSGLGRGSSPAGAFARLGERVRDNAFTRLVSKAALVYAVRNPSRVIGVGLALAALGWGLDTQTKVETNLEKLVPQSMSSLRNLNALERASGVGGEIDLMVSGSNVGTPKAIEWMSAYQSAVLKRFGYTPTRGCGRAVVCPAFSLPTLFERGGLAGGAGSASGGAAGAGGAGSPSGGAASANPPAHPKLTSAVVDALLRTIPKYLSQNAITADRKTATLAFGIRLMPLVEQHEVIETMRAALHPPPGLSAQLVGLPVLAAQSGAQVAAPWRRVLTLLAGLAAAALVLLAAFRGDRRRALTPLLPVLLATGWSALVVFAIRVPLNPMSVTLSALVIAISTEFSVLLSERYRQERIAGRSPAEALRLTYSRTGAAVAASGVTAIAGFGVLVVSDIRMLRDFGIVTLIDLTVALVGVLVALPAALMLAERSEVGRRRAATVAVDSPAAPGARVHPRHESA